MRDERARTYVRKFSETTAKDIEKILISSEKVSKRGLKIEQLDFEGDGPDPALPDEGGPPKLAAE